MFAVIQPLLTPLSLFLHTIHILQKKLKGIAGLTYLCLDMAVRRKLADNSVP